jgi:hypothetical protein
MIPPRLRSAAGLVRGGLPALSDLGAACRAAPISISATFAMAVAAAAADVVWAKPALRAPVILCFAASVITYLVALARRNERAYLVSVVTLSASCALADLPAGKAGAGVFAAIAGAVVLCVAETGAAGLEPGGAGVRLRRPGSARVIWTLEVAVPGAVLGGLLVSFRDDLAGLGLVALGFGVAAAIGVVVLVGALVRTALDGAVAGDGVVAGDAIVPAGAAPLSRPVRRVLSRRGRRRARGTKPG